MYFYVVYVVKRGVVWGTGGGGWIGWDGMGLIKIYTRSSLELGDSSLQVNLLMDPRGEKEYPRVGGVWLMLRKGPGASGTLTCSLVCSTVLNKSLLAYSSIYSSLPKIYPIIPSILYRSSHSNIYFIFSPILHVYLYKNQPSRTLMNP